MLSIADIETLFGRRGSAQYSGEPVTQLEHALQTAHFAEQSGRRRRARYGVPAARPGPPAERAGRDTVAARHRRHAPVLRDPVPARAVSGRGARDDQAARRRQALPVPGEPDYYRSCPTIRSAASRLQGGVFSAEQAHAFLASTARATRSAAPMGRPRQTSRPGDTLARALPRPRRTLRAHPGHSLADGTIAVEPDQDGGAFCGAK